MTIKEIQANFDDVSVKDGDMGQYAEIRFLGNLYIHIYQDKIYPAELYRNHIYVCLLFGVRTIKDLESLIELMNGSET